MAKKRKSRGWITKVREYYSAVNLSALERKAGVSRGAFANAMNTGAMLAADKGIKLANELGVSAHWLFDDRQTGRPSPAPSAWRVDDPQSRPALLLAAAESLRLLAESEARRSESRSPETPVPQLPLPPDQART